MSNADEKRVNRIAERKGFHLEKAGHGKGHGRFYIVSLIDPQLPSGLVDAARNFRQLSVCAALQAHYGARAP